MIYLRYARIHSVLESYVVLYRNEIPLAVSEACAESRMSEGLGRRKPLGLTRKSWQYSTCTALPDVGTERTCGS